MECRTANGDAVWPPNHLLVPWETSVVLSDVTSQPGGFTLVSVSSSDPDLGRGDGNTSGDIQGFVIGTPDTSGFVRAERSGLGGARTYTAVYEGRDQAGNVASCSIVTTFVPHDQRDKNRLR
jgi:hypothetical protein